MAAVGRFYQVMAEVLDLGLKPHCYEDAHLWLSEDRLERGQAVINCGECPLLTECDQLARAILPTFAVWGGLDWTQPSRVEGKPPKRKATSANLPRSPEKAA